jgi:hypothetical protein
MADTPRRFDTMDTEFFKTRMGQRFYEHAMPELVRQIERLVERLPVPGLSRQPRIRIRPPATPTRPVPRL